MTSVVRYNIFIKSKEEFLNVDELNNISKKKYSEISTEENTCSICLDTFTP